MSNAGHVSEVRAKIITWLERFDNNEKEVEAEDLKEFAELFGFATKVEHDAEGNQIKTLIISKALDKDEDTEKNDAQKISPTKDPTSPKLRSPFNDIEISVNVPSSSPIKQCNKASDTLIKILNLAKEALENEANSTFTKPAFLHKRISDIKISPLAMNSSNNHHLACDLNVTKTKESPTVLKSTPKKKGAVIVKPKEEKKANVSVGFKKNVLQPVQSNLQALRSKLRTPTQLRTSGQRISSITSSPAGARSIGSLSRISVGTSEKRMSSTALKKDTPLGFSRLKYPSAVINKK